MPHAHMRGYSLRVITIACVDVLPAVLTPYASSHLTKAPAMGCIASTLGGEAGSTARSALLRYRVRGGVSAMLHPCPTAYMYLTCTA